MSEYKNYIKKGIQPMRPYVPGEDLTGVGIPVNENPVKGGMIAVDPTNPVDKWYISERLFKENYILPQDAPEPKISLETMDGQPITEEQLEAKIKKNNLNAPRLTPTDIDAVIETEQYYVFPGTTMTVCCLTLKNGYTVIGEGACISPENFRKDIGEQIAKKEAREKIWALEGYLLKEREYIKKVIEQRNGDR